MAVREPSSSKDPFAATYDEARAKFIAAARTRGAYIERHAHPSLRGPLHEDLTVDVASVGDARSPRVLMIVSGTHGVEGHAGSACQVALLRSDLCTALAESCRIVLVHAINPYGFAYGRRTNEDNVDLNRNFVDFSQPLPRNAHYAEYARSYLLTRASFDDYRAARERLAREAAARGGYAFLNRALQTGQYEFSEGLFFGGSAPAWSNRIFLEICSRVFEGCIAAAVLDIHTGLGPSGVGELIFMAAPLAERYAHCFAPPVSYAGSSGSVSATIKGPLVSAACERISAPTAICCALEFGTVPIEENVHAKIFENWAYHSLAPDDPLRKESRRCLREAYFCNDAAWKARVLARSSEIIARLGECLNAPEAIDRSAARADRGSP